MNSNKQILIVDDNEEYCQNLSDIIDIKGYKVLTANNGFKALELVEENNIDLALIDMKMPEIDGVETFKRLKTISPNTPAIMITAYSMDNLINEALVEGAFGFLRKPFDFNRLFDLIESALPDGKRIMIVDDSEDMRSNMMDILSEKGYRVTLAEDGETAIKFAEEKKFDLIVIDLKLPTISGLETYLSIRKFRPTVAVIAVTGFKEELNEMTIDIVKNNAYTCLEKPIDIDRFTELIDSVDMGKKKE